ncbi:MAG: 3-isopropylmalate dehydrogenase [Candidatus Diapherotrites archaeon]|nr:3-isopropylmalate dehydrogenase [Candidatus Diapherotrites archaeon]
MAKFKIAVLSGDGIGPEIMGQGVAVLQRVGEKFGHDFLFTHALVGGCAYDAVGHPLPKETLKVCEKSDSIFFGAVGGPKWENLPAELTPERGALLPLRKHFDLFANLRPAVIYGPLAGSSPIKPEIVGDSLDILIVRELTGGIYFGRKGKGRDWASDEMKYSKKEIERIAKVAFEAALKRGKRVCSVDKANVLDTSKFWRKTISDYAKKYPSVELSHMYVDNCAMQLVRNPKQFDVIVTENMFGDILSDEASVITGSIGMLASASLNEKNFGLFEPIHGSAPDIAGQNKANPIAQILSGAMMLRYAFGLQAEAQAIENAVVKALEKGYRTADLAGSALGVKISGTNEMGEAIVKEI